MRKLPVLRRRPKQPDAAYYARLWREARAYRVDMARKRWCDYSHEHFDWEGFGDRSWRDRRRHLAVLLKAFRRAQVELSRFRGEYQLFASITPGDSGGDAVYVHTPNPNGTPFPMVPNGERISQLPPLLAGRIDMTRYQVFRYGHGPSATYTILPKSANNLPDARPKPAISRPSPTSSSERRTQRFSKRSTCFAVIEEPLATARHERVF